MVTVRSLDCAAPALYPVAPQMCLQMRAMWNAENATNSPTGSQPEPPNLLIIATLHSILLFFEKLRQESGVSCPRILGMGLKCSQDMCHQGAEQAGRVHGRGRTKSFGHTHRAAAPADRPLLKSQELYLRTARVYLAKENFPVPWTTHSTSADHSSYTTPIPQLAALRKPQAG